MPQTDVVFANCFFRLLSISDVGPQHYGISQVYVLNIFLRFRGVEEEHYSDTFAHRTGSVDFDGVDQRHKSPTKPFTCCDSREFSVEVGGKREIDRGDVFGCDLVSGDHLVEKLFSGIHYRVTRVFGNGGGASDAAYYSHDFTFSSRFTVGTR